MQIEVNMPSGNIALVEAETGVERHQESRGYISGSEVRTHNSEYSVEVIEEIESMTFVNTLTYQTRPIKRGGAYWRAVLFALARKVETPDHLFA
jgi:hypothetical protein